MEVGKNGGIDRVGSINHDPLTLSFARLKWIKLEGLISGFVEKRPEPGVDLDDIVDIVDRVSLESYEGGGLCLCEGTGDRGPLAFTSATHLFVSELEDDGIIIKCKCG